MKVRLTAIDGTLPNLALMRLAAWHRAQGDEVHWQANICRQLDEAGDYGAVYASALFGDDPDTQNKVRLFRSQWPDALIGGSGGDENLRVESVVPSQFTGLDYSGWPDFTASIGYAQRGCRFGCKFCGVPRWEGKPRSVAAVGQIWRGPGYPKHVHLLDNDFFGNPEWRSVVQELVEGDYSVCINQGINVRLLADKQPLADEQAAALASLKLRDDQFKRTRLYTAWDNIGHERVFFQGVDRLERHGFKADWIFTYMLIGFDPRETWERLFYRYNRMMVRGLRPYPMVFAPRDRQLPAGDLSKLPEADRRMIETVVRRRLTLAHFQGWVITPAHKLSPFSEYDLSHKAPRPAGGLFAEEVAA